MIGLLLITHEGLGGGYRALAEHFFGRLPEYVLIQEVLKNDAPEKVLEQAQLLLSQFAKDKSVLILNDIFGATPCNIACKILKKGCIAMITGVNAPMLIKALQYAPNASNLYDFAEEVKKSACEGIMVVRADEEEL